MIFPQPSLVPHPPPLTPENKVNKTFEFENFILNGSFDDKPRSKTPNVTFR